MLPFLALLNNVSVLALQKCYQTLAGGLTSTSSCIFKTLILYIHSIFVHTQSNSQAYTEKGYTPH